VIQAHCRQHIAGYKIPRLLVLVERVERSPSGKPDYRWAATVARAGSTDEPTPVS
jgi:acyl-CoA synthetase (AMP-forming)/AMP-acid ligase II